MFEGETVGVVVPAYNEADNVGRVIETMPGFVDRTYLVDDGSTDGTWDVMHSQVTDEDGTAAQEDRPFDERWECIQHETNRGVGAAIVTGYQRALEDGIDVVAVMAGDGQMDPSILSRIITPVVADTVDYTKGSRYIDPDDRAEMPRFRRVGSAILTVLTQIASGYWGMTDPQNGYTAIASEALEALPLEDLYTGYGFANDLLVQLNVRGFQIADVERSAEFAYEDWESDIEYSRFVPRLSGLLLEDFLWRIRRKYLFPDFAPRAVYYYGGILASLGGVGMSLARAIDRIRGDRSPADSAVPAVLLSLGVVSVLEGMSRDRRDNEALVRRLSAAEIADEDE